MVQLFPYFLLRISGISFPESMKARYHFIESMASIIDRKNIEKEHLSEALLQYARQQSSEKLKRLLFNVRRDLYNEKNLSKAILIQLSGHLPGFLREQLDNYLSTIAYQGELTEKGRVEYETLLQELRQDFKQLVGNTIFTKGLVLSSGSMLRASKKYLEKEDLNKSDKRTEIGLLQYLTRVYAKTSPYSTFTNLSVADFKDEPQLVSIAPQKYTNEIKGHVRINNFLFKSLKDLLSEYREFYLELPVRPNPTINVLDDGIHYLTNHNNVEAFQCVGQSDMVDHVIGLARKNREGIKFQSLLIELADNVNAESDQIEAFVNELLAVGLLEFNWQISGTDPDWDVALVELIQPMLDVVPLSRELCDMLIHVRTLSNLFEDAGVNKRILLLDQAYSLFKGVFMQIHEKAGLPADERKTLEELRAEAKASAEKDIDRPDGEKEKSDDEKEKQDVVFEHKRNTYFHFRPEQMFYEDTVRDVMVTFDKQEMQLQLSLLQKLYHQTEILLSGQSELAKMSEFFKKNFNGELPLLTFYEAYFRKVKMPEEEARRKKKQTQSEEEESKEIKKYIASDSKEEGLRKKWRELLSSKIDDLYDTVDGEVRLDPLCLDEINKELGYEPDLDIKDSFGSFIQPYVEKDVLGKPSLKLVLNGSFGGYGKLFSRFLHILKADVNESLKEFNSSLENEEEIFLESCDSSYFNANIHPPIMEHQIWAPGSHNSLPPEKQLAVTDFIIRLNKKEEIELIHRPSKRKAFVFDLGFQAINGRSRLYQLLVSFSKQRNYYLYPLNAAINEFILNRNQAKDGGKLQTGKINVYPRVVFAERLIIQRKRWSIPKDLVPVKKPHETDYDYFMRINLWRKKWEIPNEVFVKVNPHGRNIQELNLAQEELRKVGRDDYKPQYIHFDNPLLIRLFERLTRRIPSLMSIEEMLPNSDQLLSIEGKSYVTEYVAQWNVGGEADENKIKASENQTVNFFE